MLKKIFFYLVITILILFSIIGSIIIMNGEFNTQNKQLLFTSLSFLFNSLLIVGCYSIIGKFKIFSIVGAIVSILSFIFQIYIIWINFSLQIMLTSLIFPMALTYISLLLHTHSANTFVNFLLLITIVTILIFTIVAILYVNNILDNDNYVHMQILGVTFIISIVGTILVFITSKLKV